MNASTAVYEEEFGTLNFGTKSNKCRKLGQKNSAEDGTLVTFTRTTARITLKCFTNGKRCCMISSILGFFLTCNPKRGSISLDFVRAVELSALRKRDRARY